MLKVKQVLGQVLVAHFQRRSILQKSVGISSGSKEISDVPNSNEDNIKKLIECDINVPAPQTLTDFEIIDAVLSPTATD